MGITWLAMAHAKSVQRPVAAALPLTGSQPDSALRLEERRVGDFVHSLFGSFEFSEQRSIVNGAQSTLKFTQKLADAVGNGRFEFAVISAAIPFARDIIERAVR